MDKGKDDITSYVKYDYKTYKRMQCLTLTVWVQLAEVLVDRGVMISVIQRICTHCTAHVLEGERFGKTLVGERQNEKIFAECVY